MISYNLNRDLLTVFSEGLTLTVIIGHLAFGVLHMAADRKNALGDWLSISH